MTFRHPRRPRLLADVQLGDQRTIANDVHLLEVVQQTAALTDHDQQTTAGVVVVLVVLQMVLVEVVDALGQQRDLHLGGTGVALVAAKLLDDLRLSCLVHFDVLAFLIFVNRRRTERRVVRGAAPSSRFKPRYILSRLPRLVNAFFRGFFLLTNSETSADLRSRQEFSRAMSSILFTTRMMGAALSS